MDTKPIYELRARLRAAAIAGASLLAEDFRLKRAAEAIKPLEASSPVFAKIGQMVNQLLSPDNANPTSTLLESITLVDAVICTLGNVDVKGEIESLEVPKNNEEFVVNAPYSVLKNLTDALTTTGSGHYNLALEIRQNNLEAFQDYRVKYVLVQGLNASYAELADLVVTWLENEGEAILPFVMKDFDPKGKKEMVRRVQVIEGIAGERANDFYLKMLETAEKDVRQELIYALRFAPENIELLIDMVKTEKGKAKQMVYSVLAKMEDERAHALFQKTIEKKPADGLKYLLNVSTSWAVKMLPEIFHKALAEVIALPVDELKGDVTGVCKTDKETAAKIAALNYCILALLGKGGEEICACYRAALAHKDLLNRLKPAGLMYFSDLDIPDMVELYYWVRHLFYRIHNMYFAIGMEMILRHSLMLNPDPSLKALALELYQGEGGQKDVHFLSAAVIVKIMEEEDCTQWLEEQLTVQPAAADQPKPKTNKVCMQSIQEALSHICYSREKNSYIFKVVYSESYPVTIPCSSQIIAWMIKHASKDMDNIIHNWLPPLDEEQRRQMGEYFYQRALLTKDNEEYLLYMKGCGWTECKGLGLQYVKNNPSVGGWSIQRYLSQMPGGNSAIVEEARAIYNAVQAGEIKNKNLSLHMLDQWIIEWSKE